MLLMPSDVLQRPIWNFSSLSYITPFSTVCFFPHAMTGHSIFNIIFPESRYAFYIYIAGVSALICV